MIELQLHKSRINTLRVDNIWMDSKTIWSSRMSTVGWMEQANPSDTSCKDFQAKFGTEITKAAQENPIIEAQFALIEEKNEFSVYQT